MIFIMGISENQVCRSLNKQYRKTKSSFFRKGILLAGTSGVSYGLFSAFLTVGEGTGIWVEFWAMPLAATIIGYLLLSAVGAGLNDLISGIWCLILAARSGKIRDIIPSLRSKPALMIIAGALCGAGASTCYIVGLMMAGGIAAAITALCTAVGAILARILYKQKLNLRMIIGILICFAAAVVLGGTTLGGVDAKATLGMCIAFIAAIAWGVEGCIAGQATVLIDYEISIVIRQITSGIFNLLALVPIFCIIANATVDMTGVTGNTWVFFIGGALCSTTMLLFLVSGFFANPAYSLWYKGNAMCGTALGMVCNALYAFWVPFFCMILCGWIMGWEGYELSVAQWLMAIVEIFGIWLIAMNPLDVFRKKEV